MTTFLDRLLGRPEPPRAAKAVVQTEPWSTAIPLSSLASTPQQKAAAYLRAYKVGWFYKAGKKIADDVSTLDWSVSDGDAEEGEDESVLDRPELQTPFESLTPIEQFMRLLEKPNPSQTGRQLFRKTQVRLDFAGAAFWYLEGGLLPTALYGISPARMWPSYDKSGTLIGWVMDKDSPNPVPFDVREILPFSTGNAEDDDIWGTSVVEAVFAQVPLTNLMARHTADVLTTGGRMAGMMWPKERALDEAEFVDAQRAWRNAVSQGDAAKRLLIFPEPMEYASGASTPAEIGIPELATLNRDEILTAFPISPYQLGVPTPGGLNSGEVRREDRRDYWEGTIHPRADLLEEAIQVGLLSRYEAVMGTTFDFEIAEPNMDDAPSLAAKADAFKSLVGIGLDPQESIKAVGLGHIKFLGLPAILDPVQQQMMQEQAQQAQAEAMRQEPRPNMPNMPAKVAQAIEERERITAGLVSMVHREMGKFFREQRDRVKDAIAASMPASKAARREAMKADPDWWDSKREDEALRATMRSLYVQIGRAGLQLAADDLGRIFYRSSVDPIVTDLLAHGAARIKDINERTLQALTIELAEGTRRGYSVPQLIEGVPDEGYKGVLGVTLENGTPVFGDARAETIARTETRTSFNRSAIRGYSELGVEQFIAYDGDEDPECAERNGQTFSVEEALAEDEAEHPNGTLTMSPLVEKAHDEQMTMRDVLEAIKAIVPPAPVINFHQAPASDINVSTPAVTVTPDIHVTTPDVKVFNDVTVPEQLAPIVNVESPAITVQPPDINVTSPDVHIEPAQVTLTPELKATVVMPEQPAPVVNVDVKAPQMPTEMHIMSMPDRVTRRKVDRNKQGQITDTTDVETDG